jgi:3-hydroxymyristoyl/3-hydroxydecanoyl-(acyl carrier protein) dehydratase
MQPNAIFARRLNHRVVPFQNVFVNSPLYLRAALAAVYLPVGQMLQIDRVMEVTPDSIHCEMDLPDHWVFPLHFPGDPIFPACLMIEAAGQSIAIWAWHHQTPGLPRLARVAASFTSAVRPEDGVLTFIGKLRRRRNICVGKVELFCGQRAVASVEETLAFV